MASEELFDKKQRIPNGNGWGPGFSHFRVLGIATKSILALK